MPTPIVAPRKLIFYRLGSLNDRISIGNPRDSVQTYFFYDGNNLRADAVFLEPGIYIPSVRDLIQGTEQFVSAIGSFTGTGASVVTKADPLVGNIVGIQVTAATGTAAQLGGTLTLNPNKVVFGSGGGIEDENQQSGFTFTGIVTLDPPVYTGTLDGLGAIGTNFSSATFNQVSGLQEIILGLQLQYTPNRSSGEWQFKVLSGNIPAWMSFEVGQRLEFEDDLNLPEPPPFGGFDGPLIYRETPIVYDRLLLSVFETGLSGTELPSSFIAIGESRQSITVSQPLIEVQRQSGLTGSLATTYSTSLHEIRLRLSNVIQSEDSITATIELETDPSQQEIATYSGQRLNPRTAPGGFTLSASIATPNAYRSVFGSTKSTGSIVFNRIN